MERCVHWLAMESAGQRHDFGAHARAADLAARRHEALGEPAVDALVAAPAPRHGAVRVDGGRVSAGQYVAVEVEGGEALDAVSAAGAAARGLVEDGEIEQGAHEAVELVGTRRRAHPGIGGYEPPGGRRRLTTAARE